MSKHNRLFIIGRSGAGKGMLAQAIAKELGWTFINADVLGCGVHIGRTTLEVLGEAGEQQFNQCLTSILEHQCSMENVVVTTDDNIVCDEKARTLLKSEFSVYLKVSTPIQVQRSSGFRPLLPVSDFGQFLDTFYQERDNLCEGVASFSLSSDDGDIERHVKDVINAMNT